MSEFITGGAGSGKSTELARRIREEADRNSGVLVLAPSRASLEGLRPKLGGVHARLSTFDEFALGVLERHPETGLTQPVELIDDVQAELLFERAAAPLLTLEWTEFVEAQVDPEVPGMRAPARFLEAAFRLIRKLRAARITPEAFLQNSLAGAASFYGRPPNFAHPDLLFYTKEDYRSSLDVTGTELQRQYRREVDLAKILAKLYSSYMELQVEQGCLTGRDAIAEAARVLRSSSAALSNASGMYPSAFVDDAQDLSLVDLELLQALYGDGLAGVTLAGDPHCATESFHGARPDRVFAIAGPRVELTENLRSPLSLEFACSRLTGSAFKAALAPAQEGALTLFRAASLRAEAQFVAEHVVELLRSGSTHDQIAVLFRSVANVRAYEDALVDRNVCVETVGDLNLFTSPDVLDALALLWSVHDPFRHDFLLRILSGRALGLSDSSLYTLCNDPPDAQTMLFQNEPPADAARAARWDIKRDLRLGWNVTRGDQDARLSELARERLLRFRAMRNSWVRAARSAQLVDLARHVWAEGLAAAGEPGSARADRQQRALARLLDRIETFAASHPDASLGDFLDYAEGRSESDLEACEVSRGPRSVRIASIASVRGQSFDHVILPNARAGSFPRWYVPEAFLYSASLGMIAKENVGDAIASRTAKFTYYMYRTKTREQYNNEERRAFVYALRRARRTALVTASGHATRGITAPEFLTELQRAGIPGAVDLSDRWRPARSTYSLA
ncbi:MAG: UvrD-helicase domain-containing protein [Candidatus Eremiobacteraeota bacterium]|nr:UvrD-helicase domain-containing protein [Candidatus Eremiobacteraeota bacterium]